MPVGLVDAMDDYIREENVRRRHEANIAKNRRG